MTSMKKFKASKNIDDLIYPAWCSLYISLNWDKICFSKEENPEIYKPFVNANVSWMTNHLLQNKPISTDLITSDIRLGHLGSFVFTHHIMHLMKMAYNKQLNTMNPMDFFQDTWEVMYWFVQGSKTMEEKSFLSLINDFGDHEDSFLQTIELINEINSK
jgi:hypothetical protein